MGTIRERRSVPPARYRRPDRATAATPPLCSARSCLIHRIDLVAEDGIVLWAIEHSLYKLDSQLVVVQTHQWGRRGVQRAYLNPVQTGSRDQELDQCRRKRSAVGRVVVEVTSRHLQIVRIGRLHQQATANPQSVMRRLDQGQQRLDIQVFDDVERRDYV